MTPRQIRKTPRSRTTTRSTTRRSSSCRKSPASNSRSSTMRRKASSAASTSSREHWRHAPNGPGVYRMIAESGEVLYVGKAKNVRKRVASYTRLAGHVNRIARMISATATMVFISVETETDALLLEANLIKQMKPRFNVLDARRQILSLYSDRQGSRRAADHSSIAAPARARAIISVLSPASGRSIARSMRCSAPFFCAPASQIFLRQSHAAVPALSDQTLLGPVHRRNLDGGLCRARARGARFSLRQKPHRARTAGARNDRSLRAGWNSSARRGCATASRRSRPFRARKGSIRAASKKPTSSPSPRTPGASASRPFSFAPIRTGAIAPISRAPTRASTEAEVLDAFLAQFYGEHPSARCVLLSIRSRTARCLKRRLTASLADASKCSRRSAAKSANWSSMRSQNARQALGRKLAEDASQQRLLAALGQAFGLERGAAPHRGLRQFPYGGAQAIGAMIVAGPAGFMKAHYRTFNIKKRRDRRPATTSP